MLFLFVLYEINQLNGYSRNQGEPESVGRHVVNARAVKRKTTVADVLLVRTKLSNRNVARGSATT